MRWPLIRIFLTRQTNYKASHRALLLMKLFCLCTLGRCLSVRCTGMVLDEYGRLFPIMSRMQLSDAGKV